MKKSQPIAKPKQYKIKSVDAKARIARSKVQKIFLMSANRVNDNWWNFSVEGVHIWSLRRLAASTM